MHLPITWIARTIRAVKKYYNVNLGWVSGRRHLHLRQVQVFTLKTQTFLF
jgi:hypothetical protein